MRRDTIFRIASMTKPITSALILMLMEEGKLRLDDPIVKWVPELANRRVLKDPAGPIDDTYPAPRDITIEDLLTHRSGLAEAFTSRGAVADAYEHAVPNSMALTPEEFLAALAALPLTYAPGERWLYGYSTAVLGVLAGRIAGKPFCDLLLDRILAASAAELRDSVTGEDRLRSQRSDSGIEAIDARAAVPFLGGIQKSVSLMPSGSSDSRAARRPRPRRTALGRPRIRPQRGNRHRRTETDAVRPPRIAW